MNTNLILIKYNLRWKPLYETSEDSLFRPELTVYIFFQRRDLLFIFTLCIYYFFNGYRTDIFGNDYSTFILFLEMGEVRKIVQYCLRFIISWTKDVLIIATKYYEVCFRSTFYLLKYFLLRKVKIDELTCTIVHQN